MYRQQLINVLQDHIIAAIFLDGTAAGEVLHPRNCVLQNVLFVHTPERFLTNLRFSEQIDQRCIPETLPAWLASAFFERPRHEKKRRRKIRRTEVRNNSAWNHRHYVLVHHGITPEVAKREVPCPPARPFWTGFPKRESWSILKIIWRVHFNYRIHSVDTR